MRISDWSSDVCSSDLLDYASKIVGDRSHAEDVVQEAYLRFDAATAERSIGEPLSYLFRIVRNLSLDLRRRIGRDRGRLAPIAVAQLGSASGRERVGPYG